MGVKVREFTSGAKAPAIVHVAVHGAADLLLTLWLLDGCAECEGSPAGHTATYDIGAEYFTSVADQLSDETRELVRKVGSGEVWVGIMSLLPEEADNGTVDSFVEFISSYDPVELRYRLIMLHGLVPEEVREQAADAAEGDTAALERVFAAAGFDGSVPEHSTWAATLSNLLTMEPLETRDLISDALAAVQSDLFSKFEAEFRPALERDLKAKRQMARRLSPERLVEIATNGISVEESGYQRPILLVPTVVGRPWVVFTEWREQLIMAYPVADEYLDADPDAPPQWLIKTYKALGDERRLRILRHLSRGPASLADLKEEMDISKSTLHHHLMLLRAAGLIKVMLGTEKEYALRADVVPETAAVLQAYISAGAEEG